MTTWAEKFPAPGDMPPQPTSDNDMTTIYTFNQMGACPPKARCSQGA